MWSKKYCDNNQHVPLKDVIGNFIEYIQFHKIPATVLMQEVNPLGLVPPEIIMNALAYQVRVAFPYNPLEITRHSHEKERTQILSEYITSMVMRFLYQRICCRQTQPVSTPGSSPPTE